jgi:hypothetical protein
MSDFGTLVTVHRVDGISTSTADESLIKRASKELVYGENDRLSDYADFNLRFGSSNRTNGGNGIMVGLTEYMVGDDEGNDGLEDEVLIERDRPLAEQFGEALQELIGSEFTVEIYCGHW